MLSRTHTLLCWNVGRERRGIGFPDRDDGIDLMLPEGVRHRYTMMPVANEVPFSDLDQIDRSQFDALKSSARDPQPALACMCLTGEKRAVEVVAPPIRSANVRECHGLVAGTAHFADTLLTENLIEVEKLW